MFLLFIRHASAAPLAAPTQRDEDRPLTPRGTRRFRRVARSLARLVPHPKALLTSPLLRARQTADLAAEAWPGLRPVTLAALRDGHWPGIRRALRDYEDIDTVVLVGHEDWLSSLTAHLLGSEHPATLGFRKGGVALLELAELDAPHATLHWFIPPRVFRRL